MPFGVDIPDNIGEAPAPVETPAAEPKSLEVSESPKSETPSLPDLDKLERFRFNGREWTPKELMSAHLMREDYSKKTAELAEARKSADNFDVDLAKVQANPTLLSELKRIYPKAYGQLAERVLSFGNSNRTPDANAKDLPPELKNRFDEMDKRLSKVDDWEKAQMKAEEEKVGAWLDNKYEQLSKKYPFANTEVISGRAELALRQGAEINDITLDKLFKQNNEEIKANWEKVYKSKVDTQIKTGAKVKDMGAGGAIPGTAPKGFKTLKEATKAFLHDVGG